MEQGVADIRDWRDSRSVVEWLGQGRGGFFFADGPNRACQKIGRMQ
jgi:hypothetical protein